MKTVQYFPKSALPSSVGPCPDCGYKGPFKRNGKRKTGTQRYLCRCGRGLTKQTFSPYGRLRGSKTTILRVAHAILVDAEPVKHVAEAYKISWATAQNYADRVQASPVLLKEAEQLVYGLRSDESAMYELVEVARMLRLVTREEAEALRSTTALNPTDRRRGLVELARLIKAARSTRDLVREIQLELMTAADGVRR